MVKNILVVGDLHLREKKPYYEQTLDILNFIFSNKSFNNKETILLLLGDLVERINSTYELVQIYVDYFLNKSNFFSIKILQGNHDCALLRDSYGNISHSTVLSVLKPLPNVEIIDSWKYEKASNELPISLLYLPHYDHEGTDKESMDKVYSNLKIDNNIDFAFTHVEDETNHFGNKFCDLSNLKVKQFLNGHIHTENLSSGGRYLGAPGFNSSSEANKTPYIAMIDIESKKHKLIEVPKFVEYLTVTYPEKLPESKVKYPIFTIHDSIDKQETLRFYSEQRKDLYVRKVFTKKHKSETLESNSEYEKEDSIKNLFSQYGKDNKVSKDVSDICIDFLVKAGYAE